MKKVMFGIATKGFEREFVSGTKVHSVVNQYEGQMFLSDGTYSKVVDDFTLGLLKEKPDTIKLLCEHFDHELDLLLLTKQKIEALGGKYVMENFTWMTNMSSYPIDWLNDLENAVQLANNQPTTMTLISCKSVDVM